MKHLYLITIILILISLTAPVLADTPPSGVMTRYDHPGPLRYGGYAAETADRVWVAVDAAEYQELAGSRVSILLDDGATISAWVWDSGYLSGKCVKQQNGDCLPILFDLPLRYWRWWKWGPGTVSTGVRAWRVDGPDNWWVKL